MSEDAQDRAGPCAPLDWLNVLVADVKDGLGPFVAIYLTAGQHWSQAEAGIALSVAGVASVVARAPAGAWADVTRHKRTLLAAACLLIGLCATTIALDPRFWTVAVGQAVIGVADALIPAAIAAITLGVFGAARYVARVGRNEAFNHAGNVVTAVLAGVGGALIDQSAVLWIAATLAVASLVPLYAIPRGRIDDDIARGAAEEARQDGAGGLRALLASRPLLLFTLAITLFHFANAAMLPLAGERLAAGHEGSSSLFMAGCIVAAQAVMVPMAILAGRRADRWGRKPLLLAAFAVLPLRGVLFALFASPGAVIAIQLLDGIGAGLFGALFPVIVADLTRGSGRYNLALGASAACWGLGAALSNGVAGWIATAAGTETAFLFLGACAAAALALVWLAVPETRDDRPTMERAG